MRVGWALLLILAGCDRQAAAPAATPGARLEAMAVARGLVLDPARGSLAGSWARDTDRLCIVGPDGSAQRIGVVIDYGEGQGCSASGTLRRSGERLAIDLGADCRLDARFDGERIIFPADVPAACERLCIGRASLAALTVAQQSASASEAGTLRSRGGTLLCSTG